MKLKESWLRCGASIAAVGWLIGLPTAAWAGQNPVPVAPPAGPPSQTRTTLTAAGAPALNAAPPTPYSIGEPTAEEQLFLEYINRARAHPPAEGQRLKNTTDPDVRAAYAYFGVDLNLMASQFAALGPVPPVSMNAKLTAAARAHSQDMYINVYQDHTGTDGSNPGTRITAQGYIWNAYGECVYANAESVFYGHAGFEVDWGGTAATGGMQSPPGHREIIHSATYGEVGVGVVLGVNSNAAQAYVGPLLVTEDFGSRSGLTPFITGVAYNDANQNQFYDIGEGLGGVTVTVSGSAYYATTAQAGGYSVPVPGAGTYTVTFQAAGWSTVQTNVTVTGAANVKVDYVPTAAEMSLVTVSASPTNGGTVSGGGSYPVGSAIQLSATAANNWRFIRWGDGATNDPRSVTVAAGGVSYTALFAPTALLTVLANPANGGGVTGGGTYVVGSNALLAATASNLWRFIAWDDGVTNAVRSVVVPAEGGTYTANFARSSTVTVLASPSGGGSVAGGGSYPPGSNVTLTATPAAGWLFASWSDGSADASHSITVPAANSTYTASFVRGIGAAVDATNLTWSTGGNANWFVQSATTRDGVAALQSGALAAGQQTWFQTTTNGPGSLLFWWKLASAANNYLQFYIGTQLVSQISGNVDWNQYLGYIGTSNQVTLKWVYMKNSAAGSSGDAAFVDQVTWMPCDYATHVPQVFYQDPTGTLASWVLSSSGGMRFARLLGNTGGWALKAAGDIDGDGISDLLFETASGATAGWFMNADGSTRSTLNWPNLGGWEIKACGDYEGIGHGQVFFQTTRGDTAYWRLDTHGTPLLSVSLGNMGGWKLRGIGDLDGDHKAELFWQNAAGLVVIWYHNPDGTIRSVPAFSTGGWGLCGVLDIDNDGVSDLLWQDGVGNTGGWFMNSNGSARAASYWWNTGGWKLKSAGR